MPFLSTSQTFGTVLSLEQRQYFPYFFKGYSSVGRMEQEQVKPCN